MYRCRYPPTPEPLFFAKHGLKITILTHFRALFYPYLLSLVHFQPIGPSKTFLALFQKSFISRRIQIFIGICISQHASVFVVIYILPLFATEVWVVRREGCNSIFFDKRTWHPDFGGNFTPKPLILNLFHFSHFFFWLKLWVSMKTMKCKLGWWVFSFTSYIVIPFWTIKLSHLNLKRQKKSFSPFVSSLNTKGL